MGEDENKRSKNREMCAPTGRWWIGPAFVLKELSDSESHSSVHPNHKKNCNRCRNHNSKLRKDTHAHTQKNPCRVSFDERKTNMTLFDIPDPHKWMNRPSCSSSGSCCSGHVVQTRVRANFIRDTCTPARLCNDLIGQSRGSSVMYKITRVQVKSFS